MEEKDSASETHKMHKKHSSHKEYLEHKEHKQKQTFMIATWTLGGVCVILVGLLIAAILTGGFGGKEATGSGTTVKALTADEVKAKTQVYLNGLLAGQTVTIDSVTDAGDLYALKVNVDGQIYDSYARKDGSLLFPSSVNLNQAQQQQPNQQQQQQPTNVPKTDKPVVELFVMSHCPFGTQAEKGMLPAVRTLGDKVDFKVKFVYYAMHGETEVVEQLNQYCIQKEQPDVYLNYLACFLNASDGAGCLKSTGVDEAKMKTCTDAADKQFSIMASLNDKTTWLNGRFPKFNTDLEANQKYGIGGSPTLVINGVESNAGRDSASYLAAICAAFNNAPAECNTQLSSASPGPGFGYDSTAAATAAGCGV